MLAAKAGASCVKASIPVGPPTQHRVTMVVQGNCQHITIHVPLVCSMSLQPIHTGLASKGAMYIAVGCHSLVSNDCSL